MQYNISHGIRYVAESPCSAKKEIYMDYTELAADLFCGLIEYSGTQFQAAAQEFSAGEIGVLAHLCAAPSDVSAGELSEYLKVSTGRVAAVLNTLEKKNMIRRLRDSSDKRRVIVHITDEGRKTVQKKYAEGIACAENILQKLGEHDAEEFARIIKKIISL